MLIGLLSIFYAEQSIAGELSGKTVRFCGDGSGWPPYTYLNPEKPDEVLGFDVEVVREILQSHGIEAEFFMPSWKQCIEHTENGEVFHAALSASFSEERNEKYLLTAPYYQTTQSYFYSRKRFPDGPVVRYVSDLFEYGRVCGRYSYNYEGTGVLKNDQIAMIGKTYTALVRRTLSDDCAFFLGRPSIILGFGLVGKKLFSPREIGFEPLPGAKKDDFHIMISRKVPYAEELKTILDEGIAEMRRSGRLLELLDSYYKKMNS